MNNIISPSGKTSSRYLIILAFAGIYIIWGSTYFAILFTIKDIPPFLMSGFRFLAAGVLLYVWCLLKRKEPVSFSSFYKNSAYGILMLGGGTLSVAWAEQYISSSAAAIIVTSVPFWFVLLDKKQWSFYFSNKLIIAGLITGFAGVILLLKGGHTTSHLVKNEWLGYIIIIAGGIAWTTGSLFSKYKPAGNSTQMNAAIQLLVSGLFCMMTSIFSGEAANFSFVNVTTSAWLGFFYLVIPGSLIAYLSYLWLLKVRPVAQVSTYVYVNPVVAVLLGSLAGNEKITLLQIGALAVILTGVLFVNKVKYKSSSKKFTFSSFKKYANHRA